MARIVGDKVGSGDQMLQFLHDHVFEPMGMPSATAQVDTAGTFIGSSYVYATAREWAHFGQCYLQGGVGVGGARVLSESWVAQGLRGLSIEAESGASFGELWWVLDKAARSTFYADGFQGQRVVVCPELDLVVARFGASQEEQYDALQDWLGAWWRRWTRGAPVACLVRASTAPPP